MVRSHIGASLSQAFGVDFYDCDALIEAEQVRSIAEIFDKDGEAYFRDLERDKIAELLGKGACVISTGGGAVTVPENLSAIKKDSISVWLQSDVHTIFERVKGDESRAVIAG